MSSTKFDPTRTLTKPGKMRKKGDSSTLSRISGGLQSKTTKLALPAPEIGIRTPETSKSVNEEKAIVPYVDMVKDDVKVQSSDANKYFALICDGVSQNQYLYPGIIKKHLVQAQRSPSELKWCSWMKRGGLLLQFTSKDIRDKVQASQTVLKVFKNLFGDAIELSIPKRELNASNGAPSASSNTSVVVRGVSVKYAVDVIQDTIHDDNPEWKAHASVERMQRWNRDKQMRCDIPLLKITFENADDYAFALKFGIKLGYEHFSVREWIIRPRIKQCYRCLKYGHIAKHCKQDEGTKTCSKCATDGHTSAECVSQATKCKNCGGGHVAFSNECPVRKRVLDKLKKRYASQDRKAELRFTIRQQMQRFADASDEFKHILNEMQQEMQLRVQTEFKRDRQLMNRNLNANG
jgi:hypothetical protein